jgi:ABC-2 family transporter protein
MLVTDLADREIVLGKLAARFLPVVGLVAATIPVLALAGLLGGVIFEAIVSLTLITLAIAVFGCSLALAISVRATKAHEVLMAVYGIESLWILSPLVWDLLSSTQVVPPVPTWIVAINPLVLAWAPYAWPSSVSVAWIAESLGALVVISAGLVAYAVFRLRAEVSSGTTSGTSRFKSWLGRVNARHFWWRPGPSLDNDPVLWRECRRGRPSRLAVGVWSIFVTLSIAGMAAGIVTIVNDYQDGSAFLMFVSGLHATFGLLLVSLFSPTLLAEERVRGSLDVLMTTPLSTDCIVMAKWWGAFRVVPALAFLPAISSLIIAMGAPDHVPAVRGMGMQQVPPTLDEVDRIAYVCLPMALLLAQGAAVTSVGLLLATWIRRVGRAVAVSVTSYACFAFGWVFLIEIGQAILDALGLWRDNNLGSAEFFVEVIGAACPFGGQFFTFETASWPAGESRLAFYIAQVIVLLATIGFALLVLALTLLTFDRCVGRVSERPRRAPRAPRRAARPLALNARPADSRYAASPRPISVT